MILVHPHCYQKSLGTAADVMDMLHLLPNTTVEEIATNKYDFFSSHFESNCRKEEVKAIRL